MEDLIELTEVPKLLPHRPSYPPVFRWVLTGIGGTRLEAVRMGRRWYTTRTALDTFSRTLAAQTIERLRPPTMPTTKTKSMRTEEKLQSDLTRAQREFDRPAR
jgi:hypothetical protein